MLKILKTVEDVKAYRRDLNLNGMNLNVGFVPTMGSLHLGHFELIKQSQMSNDVTVVSIFVNPTQFNNRNDFDSYPNHIDEDLKALNKLGVQAVLLPTEKEIYPKGYNFKLTENSDSLDLCGQARPGHFDGVLTVLIKLFNLVQPQNVYMGLKDYQQFRLVKNMAEDLFLNLNVIGVETVREESGLALSSRNLNLSPEQKQIAEKYAAIFAENIDLESMRSKLETLDLKIDYLVEKWGRKFIAVFIGDVRLIDNRELVSPLSITNAKLQEQIKLKTESARLMPLNQNSVETLNFVRQDEFSPKNILFKMSGSIACFKACDVISKLVQAGHNVQVVTTKDVLNFVGAATLEGLTARPVLTDLYQSGDMMSHIHLNDWCDITVLCPASANTIVKTSMGLSDNLVTALSLSSNPDKPYLVFPAMNSRMMDAIPLQTALKNLGTMNRTLVFGNSGRLACGYQGQGRLAEPEIILKEITKALKASPNKDIKTKPIVNQKKILITAGGTSEPIDPVRYVTNTSSGETGLKICEHLAKDYEVFLLGSLAMKAKVESSSQPLQATYFKSFKDLEQKLSDLLKNNEFEAIVHLAAVSDYSPVAIHLNEKSIDLPTEEKISSNEDFFVEFKRNKKLITEIKNQSLNKNIKIIGFKLLRTDDQEKITLEIDKVLKDSDCVVVNSLENISDKKHIYEIYNLSGLVFHGNSKSDMAEDISKILKNEVTL